MREVDELVARARQISLCFVRRRPGDGDFEFDRHPLRWRQTSPIKRFQKVRKRAGAVSERLPKIGPLRIGLARGLASCDERV